MKSSKKIVVIGTILLLLLIFILVGILYVQGTTGRLELDDFSNNDSSTTSANESPDTSFSELSKQCQQELRDSVQGKWLYQGGEFEISPYIILQSDGRFIFYGWGGDGVTTLGAWEFNEKDASIKFKFDKLNSYWALVFHQKIPDRPYYLPLSYWR